MAQRRGERTTLFENTFRLHVERTGNIHLVPRLDLFTAELADRREAVTSVRVTRSHPREEAALLVARRTGLGGAMIDWVAESFLLAIELELSVSAFRKIEPITFVILTHDRAIFMANIGQSDVIKSGRHEVLVLEGAPSAAKGLQAGLDAAKHEYVAFVHHDVYLPPGWETQLGASLDAVNAIDPEWGVLGVAGSRLVGERAHYHGSVFDAPVRRRWGYPWELPRCVDTLDELLILVRKSAPPPIDLEVAGFHGYGTQLCLGARRAGRKNYVILAECEHRSNSYDWKPDRDYFETHAAIAERWADEPYGAMLGVPPGMFPADLAERVVAAWNKKRGLA